MEQYTPYAIGIGALVINFLVQNNVFVRPVDLEKKHKEIIDEATLKMNEALKEKASVDKVESLSCELSEIKGKLNEIYNILIKRS